MANEQIKAIDASKLPKHFESIEAEERWDEFWQKNALYAYDSTRSRAETFSVDTPPPTVSGSLHIGHVFSYTHTDVVVRYQRMNQKNIFYPMGWDDNGLPTERRVQNYFHVRCDPQAAYEKDLKLEQANAKARKDRPRIVSRPNFIELCQQVTKEDEIAFMALFKRIGLSVDWSQEYSTINDRCRKTAQLSFIDLFEKKHVYSLEAPTMWDVDFQTAVAQAELEDREMDGAFHDIRFGVENSDKTFVISTTRPELLAACVGVTAHPDDKRYKEFFGKNAVTPLFHMPVPIFPSELADPEKGTGILMVCTFGDQTDVQWWKEKKLKLRQIVGRNGRMQEVKFGSENWQSLKPKLANKNYAEIVGKNTKQAKAAMVALLKEEGSSVSGHTAALQKDPKPIKHAVKFFEKGDRPLEFVSTRQWFVSLLDKKEALLKNGSEIKWYPPFMESRYRNWTENLALDWCISRQRYFGVPFPVWYKANKDGEPNYDEPLLAEASRLPIDPTTETPAGYTEDQRNQPNGFVAETDVFDTWFTSSMTPQIGTKWLDEPEQHKNLFPMSLRPQGHDIIRTWAFYTIAKSLLHENSIPWQNIHLSGWILDPDRKKMSKSKGNVVTPTDLLDEYSADAIRYWASSARLGTDTAFDPQVLKIGRRLVTKIYNASKFVLSQTGPKTEITEELDRAFIHELRKVVEAATKSHEEHNFASALHETEKFFWNSFTDTYLEMVKLRAREGSDNERGSAIAALRMGLQTLIRLFAPSLPFITEEVWSWVFAEETNVASVHRAAWPQVSEFADVSEPSSPDTFQMAVECFAGINKYKTANGLSMGTGIEALRIKGAESDIKILETGFKDICAATKLQKYEFEKLPKRPENAVFEIAAL